MNSAIQSYDCIASSINICYKSRKILIDKHKNSDIITLEFYIYERLSLYEQLFKRNKTDT